MTFIELNTKNYLGYTAFHFACIKGHSEIAKMLMKNSAEFNIELNTKDTNHRTPFHWACRNGANRKYGRTSIVEMMLSKSIYHKLDLTARDGGGKTGFQLAQDWGATDVVNLILNKKPQIAF